MEPKQVKVDFDLNTTIKTLTSRIAYLEEQNALNLGRIASYEIKEQQRAEALASVPQNGEAQEN